MKVLVERIAKKIASSGRRRLKVRNDDNLQSQMTTFKGWKRGLMLQEKAGQVPSFIALTAIRCKDTHSLTAKLTTARSKTHGAGERATTGLLEQRA